MHNRKYVACVSKSGVRVLTVFRASTSAPSLCSVSTSTQAALLGCAKHSEVKNILIKLNSNCFPDTEITFFFFGTHWAEVPIFG